MRTLSILAAAGLVASCSLAQPAPKPDFSGTWVLDKERSRLQIPAPDSTTFVVEHSEPSFKLTRTHVVDGKPDTFSIALTTDGKEVVTRQPDEVVTSTCRWEGEKLRFDSTIVRGDRRGTNLVTYSLSPDGKTFTALERFAGPKVKYENVWVFARK